MILQARRVDTDAIVSQATHVGPLALGCARYFAHQIVVPRLSVFRSCIDDRWYLWEKERELARCLMIDHDLMTAPMRERVRETVFWLAENVAVEFNPDNLRARVAWAFGQQKLGERCGAWAEECYLVARNPCQSLNESSVQT
jgi:hypothetical protein